MTEDDPARAAARLRRAQPRNPDVQAVCDDRDRLQREFNALKRQVAVGTTVPNPVGTTQPLKVPVAPTAQEAVAPTDCPECAARRDKRRVKMQQYRAKTKAKG